MMNGDGSGMSYMPEIPVERDARQRGRQKYVECKTKASGLLSLSHEPDRNPLVSLSAAVKWIGDTFLYNRAQSNKFGIK